LSSIKSTSEVFFSAPINKNQLLTNRQCIKFNISRRSETLRQRAKNKSLQLIAIKDPEAI